MGCKNTWELQLFWTPQKRTVFLPAGEEKHNFSSRAIIIAPSPWLGFLAGKAEKESKVGLPSSPACRKVSYLHLTFFLPFSWLLGNTKRNLEMAAGVFFSRVPPRHGHTQASQCCLPGGWMQEAFSVDMGVQSQAAQAAPALCREVPAPQQLLWLSPCLRCAHLQLDRNCLEGARSSAGRSQGSCCPQRQGHQWWHAFPRVFIRAVWVFLLFWSGCCRFLWSLSQTHKLLASLFWTDAQDFHVCAQSENFPSRISPQVFYANPRAWSYPF